MEEKKNKINETNRKGKVSGLKPQHIQHPNLVAPPERTEEAVTSPLQFLSDAQTKATLHWGSVMGRMKSLSFEFKKSAFPQRVENVVFCSYFLTIKYYFLLP